MRSRHMLLGAFGIASATVLGMASAGATLPSTATKIAVSAGGTIVGIDGHLHPAASIAGTFTAGGAHPNAVVRAYLGDMLVNAAATDPSTGHYLIGGLRPSSTGYDICASGDVGGGSSTTGYRGRCYRTAAWNGGTVPAGAQEIPLSTAQHRKGIDITLPRGGAIAGRLTNPAGHGVRGDVKVRNRATGQPFSDQTDDAGRYKILGLTPSASGYSVCFDPRRGSSGTYGYRPACYSDVAWNGGAIPSASTRVNVTMGHTHRGISQVVTPAGAISGTLTESGTGYPVPFSIINVFNSAGTAVASAYGSGSGQYVVKGLPAGTAFRVCSTPIEMSSAVSYTGQCWDSVAWDGGSLPGGTTDVSTALGQTHTGIDFVLTKVTTQLGTISGRITEKAFGQPMQGATAELVSSSGTVMRSTSTDADGHYLFGPLPASAPGYIVCATAGVSTTPTPPTGWAPRCHTDVEWDGASPPTSATPVPLLAGQDVTGIDVALHVGGTVTGTVSVAGGSAPISNVQVQLFTPSGRVVATAHTAIDGTYEFSALGPVAAGAGYIACFEGSNLVGTAGYLPQCYDHASWNGIP